MTATVVSPTGLLPVVFDPDTPGELDINDGHGYVVHADLSMPPPPQKPQYASSVDTEGSIPVPDSAHYENREITINVRVYGNSDNQVEDRLSALYERMGRIHRQGGVLSVTLPAGRTIYFDLVGEADAETSFDDRWLRFNKTDVAIRLSAKPFWRGVELELGTFTETTIAALIATVDVEWGDVPALGRIVVTDLQGVDQWTAVVGVQSDFTTDPEEALWFTASQFTPLGNAITFGTGISTVNLTPASYVAIMRSQLVSNHSGLRSTGGFRVFARLTRPTSNTGIVSVALEWGEGDYHLRNVNDAVTFPVDDREGTDTWTDLGTVTPTGPWEFRLLATSTVQNDSLTVKEFLLVPTESYRSFSGRAQFEFSSAFLALDTFNQTAGALTGKPLDVGGNWAAVGDADDFTVDAVNHWISRASMADDYPLLGRTMLAGTATYSDITVSCAFQSLAGIPTDAGVFSVVARWVDANNLIAFWANLASQQLAIVRVTAATSTSLSYKILASKNITIPTFTVIGLRLEALANGQLRAWYWNGLNTSPTPTLTAHSAEAATGGPLASGRFGFSDWGSISLAGPMTRLFDAFYAFTPTPDAAIFANRSLELSHDSASRQSADGSIDSPIVARGPYLRFKPGRNRIVVKGFRNDPYTMANPDVDDLKLQAFASPRGLVVPGN